MQSGSSFLTMSRDTPRDGEVRSPSYVPILASYLVLAATATAVLRSRHKPMVRPSITDVALLGLGTFKLSRLVTRERVLQPVRQPFVEDSSADGIRDEVTASPAGSGLRLAIGQLLTCPFCISVWIATVLVAMFATAPRAVRLIVSGLTAVVIADVSQYAYVALFTKETEGGEHA